MLQIIGRFSGLVRSDLFTGIGWISYNVILGNKERFQV
jgi:hypothetical protein